MKKILFILLTSSFIFNIYLLDTEVVVQDNFNDYSAPTREVESFDEVKLAQSSVANKEINDHCPPLKKTDLLKSEKKPVSDASDIESQKEIQEKIKSTTKKWLADSERFFVDEIRISDEQIARYHELAKERQREIDIYFQPKMDKLKEDSERSGDKKTFYMHTTEDSVFLGEVAMKYDSLLKETFSENAYKDYKEFVRNYNQELMNSGFFYPIEF